MNLGTVFDVQTTINGYERDVDRSGYDSVYKQDRAHFTSNGGRMLV